MRRITIVGMLVAVLLASCGTSERGDVVAAGTTLVDSGFMAELTAAYEGRTGRALRVVALSSAEALAYLDAGTAQAAITHNPELSAAYAAAHPESVTSPVFVSEFIVVGPSGTTVTGSDVVDVFATVAGLEATFVSRDDGSGTHARERAIWDAAGIDPDGRPWYVRTGTGMGSTLQVADQRNGYTLSELGSYLAAAETLGVQPVLVEDIEGLANPYTATLPDASSTDAADFVAWLSSDEGRTAIDDANTVLFGRPVYRSP